MADQLNRSGPGEIHKRQRKMLNPVFSTAHLRNLIPVFDNVARKLESAITAKLNTGSREIDILHWTSRAALEIIGQSALGYSFDSLVEGAEPHPFGAAAKEFRHVGSPATDDLLFLREYLLQTLIKIGPPHFRRFVVDHFPWKALRRIRDVIDTMDRVTTYIFEEKKRALASLPSGSSSKQDGQIAEAKDLIAILMKANMQADEEDRLPDKEVLAQVTTILSLDAKSLIHHLLGSDVVSSAITFAFAGTDTTSNVLARILDLLSYRPEIQDKLRDEITATFGNCTDSDISYDKLMSLPFLDAVSRETLRLATKDCILPLSTPIRGRDGWSMNSIFVPAGTRLFVSIRDINRDPMLWGPDSYEWKPERWLSRLPQAVYDARVPGVYSHMLVRRVLEEKVFFKISPSMTFLGGARACIGFKFSELEIKVVLARLITKFRFSPSGKDIVWEMSGISTPTVKGFSGQPQLPIAIHSA
ncbi:hypothetical protein C0995_008982 [Termitomyces sp. Mi166|nr:hypothetical protein C0995_008982 [Termitomyces sp. Mi166\